MRRAFTVLELVIVVLAIGILATLVVPQFSHANQRSKQDELRETLQYLRTQIAVFKAQHQDVPPGYVNGNPAAPPMEQAFETQMTQHSDVMSRLGPAGNAFPYGPYLKYVPADPLNGLNTVEMVPNDSPLPKPDGTTGWIYKPQTQEIIANAVGTDESQTEFSSY